MTIREVIHFFQGAEYGSAICHDVQCRDKFGARILASFHNGYGSNPATEHATPDQIISIYNAGKNHPRKHDVRLCFGHMESLLDTRTGTSVVVYSRRSSKEHKRKK